MGNFTFTSLNECELCGKSLPSSDEDCDHDGQTVYSQVFRPLGEGRAGIVGVRSTTRHKWYALEERVGDDWIRYSWLGPRESVNVMLHNYGSVESIPHRQMSVDAPNDVGESNE